MGLFSSSKSYTTNQTDQYFSDNRTVNDAGGGIIGTGNTIDASQDQYWQDLSNRSTNVLDASNRSTNIADLSNRSTNLNDLSNRSTNLVDASWAVTDASDYESSFWQDLSNRSMTYEAVDTSNRSVTNNNTTNLQAVDPGLVRIAQLQTELAGAVAESQTDATRFMAAAGFDFLRAAGGSATDLLQLSGANASRAWESTLDKSAQVVADLLDGARGQVSAAQGVAQSAIASYQPTESKTADVVKWLGLAVVAALVLGPMLKGR